MAISKTVRTVLEAPAKRDYEVLTPGWVAGAYRKKGDEISLTEAAAKYDVLGGKLEAKKATRSPRSEKDAAKPVAASPKSTGD